MYSIIQVVPKILEEVNNRYIDNEGRYIYINSTLHCMHG